MGIIEAAGITDIGKRKVNNEDCMLIDDTMNLYAIADGMGGHKAGEVASSMMIEILHEYMQAAPSKNDINGIIGADSPVSDIAKQLIAGINRGNRSVFRSSRDNIARRGMGTTISAVYFTPSTMIAGNVGDSPIYMIRNDNIELISTLHTVMAEQEALAPEGAKPLGNQFRHMLTRAVGTRETVRVDTVEWRYLEGDIIVICSDGLSDLVTPEEVCNKATSLPPEKACYRLMELANERGGDDNITVIVLRVQQSAIDNAAGAEKKTRKRKKAPDAKKQAAARPKLPVDYDTDDSSYHGYATELSEAGVFIATHESFTIGQETMLTIGTGSGKENLMVSGTVAVRTSEGIHVRFNEITDRQLELIRELTTTAPGE